MRQKKDLGSMLEPNSRMIDSTTSSMISVNINSNIKSQETRKLDNLIYEIERLLEK